MLRECGLMGSSIQCSSVVGVFYHAAGHARQLMHSPRLAPHMLGRVGASTWDIDVVVHTGQWLFWLLV
jgi:hypothetical protein